MSYHRRFVWTRIHRPVLQTFILVFLCIISVFNLFFLCSGSLSNTPNIDIASQSPQTPEIRRVDLNDADDAAVINNSEPTESTKNIYDENDITNIFQPVPSLPSTKDHSTNSIKSSKEVEEMLKQLTEQNVIKKTTKSKASKLDENDEIFISLKEQDEKLGVQNVDTEPELTTVENATEQSTENAEIRATRNPDYDDDFEDDEAEELIEIILNTDKPGIRELPFCKESHDHATSDDHEEKLALVKKKRLLDGKLIVVATLDGKISFMDQSGNLHWSFSTGSFFSSSISSMQLTENGKLVKLMPSLTGGLYKFDGQRLQAMPVTADSLLMRSFKMASDVVITGGRELKTYGLDLKSGELKYECGMDGCKSSADSKVEASTDAAEDNEDNIVLVIKKNLQTIRAIESMTGSERWNFSVATHELAIAGLTEGCHQGASVPIEGSDKNHSAITESFRMLIPEGIVFGADAGNKIVWQHKFESPISQAWVLNNGQLTIIDPMKCTPMMTDNAPSLYVGMHKQQFYVQESQSTTKKIRTKYELTNLDLDDQEAFERLRIEWKPLTVPATTESTALSPVYHEPFYVFDHEEIVHNAIEHNTSANAEDKCNKDEPKEDPEDSPLIESGVVLTIATLIFYWKEVLGISFLTALILLIPVVRIVRNRTTRQLLGYLRQRLAEMHIWQQTQQQQNERALVLYRNGSETMASNTTLSTSLNSSSTFDQAVRTRSRTRTGSSSSNHSFADDQLVPFVSQYIKEFEPIQCLGRGGFGVVFEARKKIDDRCYAVKRIPLPNRPKSRDRVMREVKALAKLDHKNIVRYFNAWIENPPVGWLERNDPLWNQCIVSSPSPTSEYPSEILSEDASLLDLNSKRRRDHYEISLAGFTPDKETIDIDNDDSFIVFEASGEEEQETDTTDSEEILSMKARSSVEVIDIPSQQNSENKNYSSETEIEAKRAEGLWKSPNSNDSSICDSLETSKFFVRPTTLNIPSSSSNKSFTSNNNDDSETSESPLGIMYLYIQQELCQKRTLQEWLAIERERDLRQVVKMFIQIVEAVEYIHSKSLIHRDLKPSNIFLAGGNTSSSISDIDETGDQNKEMTVKIGDFGLVTTSDVSKLPDENGDPAVGNEKPNSKLTGLVGTTLYMSYEQSQRKSYDHKVDIYSLGLILFEMIVPFATNMERYDLLSKVRALEVPQAFVKNYPEEYKLIRRMVSHNPKTRPEAAEIKSWLAEHLSALNSETHITRTLSNWHRSKSSPTSHKNENVTKILKAHSFI